MLRRAAVAALTAALVVGLVCAPARAGVDAEGRTTHTVYAGQTLAKIAKRYHITVDDLCHANGLRRGARIHAGQELVIPDGTEPDPEVVPKHQGNRWQDYAERPRKKGFVILQSPTRRWRGFIVTKRGKVQERSVDAIEHMFASWRTGVEHEIDPRLIQLVARISDTFGGRPIRVVSGYREKSFAVESKHKVGRAFDFSIPGIPNPIVRDYLRTLPNVGVGYYPNSTHVHVDVREESAYWVDDAGPGEPPKYAHGGHTDTSAADSETTELPPPSGTPSAEPAPVRVE